MKKNMKVLVLGLVVTIVLSVGAAFAADKTATATPNPAVKTSTVSTSTATTDKVKLSQADVTKIALTAYKDAKVLDVKLNGKIYTVNIQNAKGSRTLQIGANTGKILKDVAAPATKSK